MKITSISLKHKLEIIDNNIYVNNQIVDNDADTIKRICDKRTGKGVRSFSDIYVIDVTSNCNTKCVYCYYPITTAEPDRDLESILLEAAASGKKEIALMGAEPTTRNDICEIIRTLTAKGYNVGIGTNGLKLVRRQYLDELIAAGLKSLNYSMHFSNEFEMTKSKLRVLKNIIDVGITVLQLSFTVTTYNEIQSVLSMIKFIRIAGLKPKQFCIRAGAAIGECKKDSGLYLSSMIKLLESSGAHVLNNSGNNLYYCEMSYDSSHIHLARWPTNETALPFSHTGPVFGTKAGPTLSPMTQIVQSNKGYQLTDISLLQLEHKNVLF